MIMLKGIYLIYLCGKTPRILKKFQLFKIMMLWELPRRCFGSPVKLVEQVISISTLKVSFQDGFAFFHGHFDNINSYNAVVFAKIIGQFPVVLEKASREGTDLF